MRHDRGHVLLWTVFYRKVFSPFIEIQARLIIQCISKVYFAWSFATLLEEKLCSELFVFMGLEPEVYMRAR